MEAKISICMCGFAIDEGVAKGDEGDEGVKKG